MKLVKENIPFTMVANEILYDPNLSFKAKGLYSYLFSKPDEWDFSSNRITMETRDGRKSIMASLRELEKVGALGRRKLPNGKMEYILKYSTLSPEMALRLNNGLKQPKSPLGTVPKRLSAESSPISNKEKKVRNDIDAKASLSTLSENEEIKTVGIGGDFGDPVPERKKSVLDPLNKVALGIRSKFSELCEKSIGIKPVEDVKGYQIILFALKKGGMTKEMIYDLFDEWFGLGKPNEEVIQITRALSGNQINSYKVRNQ
jgi:hypothetical protein